MERQQLISTVAAAQNGDMTAMNALFAEYYEGFYYFALKTVRDRNTAADVTQESFIEIFSTIGKLREPAAFVTWAKKITYHQCTRHFKSQQDEIQYDDSRSTTVFDSFADDATEFVPDAALDQSEFKGTIMKMLDGLSEVQCSAAMMYYFDEMSVREIAEIQCVSEGTVKSRLNYARSSIKTSVEEYETRHNIKLHAVSCFGLFKWMFDGAFSGIPAAAVTAITQGVSAATGVAVSAGASVATATAAASATATVGATSAAAVGLGAKVMALPLATKIIAGVVAVTVAVGVPYVTINTIGNNSDDTSASSRFEDDDFDYREPTYEVPKLSYTEEMADWDAETALKKYCKIITLRDISLFDSPQEISVDDAFCLSSVIYIDSEYSRYKWSEEDINDTSKQLFGKEFSDREIAQATGKFNQLSESGKFYMITGDISAIGEKLFHKMSVIENPDGSYSSVVLTFNKKVLDLPEGDIMTSASSDFSGGYDVYSKFLKLTVKKVGGVWRPISLTEAHSGKDLEECIFVASTEPYMDTKGVYVTDSISLQFTPTAASVSDWPVGEVKVSKPTVYVSAGNSWYYVPEDVGDNELLQQYKQRILDSYNTDSPPSWEEHFTNSRLFKDMHGIEIDGVKYIRTSFSDGGNDGVGTEHCYYYYDIGSDNSATLTSIPELATAEKDSTKRILSIKFSDTTASVIATYQYSDGHTEDVTLRWQSIAVYSLNHN